MSWGCHGVGLVGRIALQGIMGLVVLYTVYSALVAYILGDTMGLSEGVTSCIHSHAHSHTHIHTHTHSNRGTFNANMHIVCFQNQKVKNRQFDINCHNHQQNFGKINRLPFQTTRNQSGVV